ncbi:MAG: phosphopantothenoylcysteine decarboxylase, partial [Planctomycetota bacterium]
KFETTADLDRLLHDRVPDTDVLVMAAAVADHTPAVRHPGKLGRNETGAITIDLVPTPDLLASVAASARPDQLLVGFALEPADRLAESAQRKLETKHVDLIVANPLDTMESSVIEATLFPTAVLSHLVERLPGRRSKESFAAWLIPMLVQCLRHKANR